MRTDRCTVLSRVELSNFIDSALGRKAGRIGNWYNLILGKVADYDVILPITGFDESTGVALVFLE